VLLIAGLVVLVAGAEAVVRGAGRLAALAGVSPLVIGLTVVAFGTSAPELAVNVQAAWRGASGLGIGNVVGSNIFNVLLILGLSAIITPLTVARQLVRLDVPVMIGVSFLAGILVWDGKLGRWEGGLLTALLMVYLATLYVLSRRAPAQALPLPPEAEPERPEGVGAALLALLLAVAGIAMLVMGARMLVRGGVDIATALGVNETVIGLTIVAIGTSLPEVATSVVASLRGQRDLAVGNVVGSNIFNILSVLGLASLVAPGGIAIPHEVIRFDIPLMIAVAVLCLPVFVSGAVISRFEGALFLSYYVCYTVLLILTALDVGGAAQLDRVLAFVVMPGTALVLGAALLHVPPSDRTRPGGGYAQRAWRRARLAVLGVTGGTALLAATAVFVLPVPGLLSLGLGLLVLTLEFTWAHHYLAAVRSRLEPGVCAEED
jgi:cation:H+ antiporter